MSLEEDLKEFEKDLSLLLVRFMKIYDAYHRVEKRVPNAPPAELPPPRIDQPPATSTDLFAAYS